MDTRANAFLRHQQQRWLRPDAARWVRPDAAKFLKPGTRREDIYPALEQKYNADQPRVPAGETGGGQWTSGSSGSGRPRVYITGRDDDETGDAGSGGGLDLSLPNISIDFGDIASEIDKLDLFGLKPRERPAGGVRLAGKPPTRLPPIVVTPKEPRKRAKPGIGHNGGPPLEPPKIPINAPPKSSQITAFLRQAANWISRALRARGPAAVAIYVAELVAQKWLDVRRGEIEPYNDPPKSLKELHDAVKIPRAGTEVHHIAEQTALRNSEYPAEIINAPENLVRISTLKHYDITLWYRTPYKKFGGLTPRQYLSDKPLSERMKVGRDALIIHKVLKP